MRHLIRCLSVLCCVMLLLCCMGHDGHRAALRPADVLVGKARDWQYRDIDSAHHYATLAYAEADRYVHGRSVACNMLGFVAYMKMDYADAIYWYDQVEQRAGCELERLVADVGRMHVYLRVADNLAFYDCRVRAMRRLSHINEEADVLAPAEQQRLRSTVAELHMVSALHHYMMGQRPEAYAEMHLVPDDQSLRADTALWLMRTYMKGVGLDVEGDTREERRLRRFAYLTSCLRTSRAGGYTYYEGMASVALSELLTDSARLAHIAHQRPRSMAQLLTDVGLPDTPLASSVASMTLAVDAQQLLATYGDRYGAMNAAIQQASLHNHAGRFEASLAILDTLTTILIPDAQARRHEEMSVAYAGLGDKLSSDHHRNLYLDILESTRQNKEVESRYLMLQRRGRTMKVMLYVIVIGALLLIVLLAILGRRRRRGSGYEQRLLEQLQEAEKRVYIHQRHVNEGRRDNIVRKASLSMVMGMMPYIDRMAHEAERLQHPDVWADEALRTRKLHYMAELADEINLHNEQLAQWVKTKQGMVRLTIETFPLSDVFGTIERSASTFALRGITLTVQPTEAVVKADKALTFFMLNTLADNARKFTPEGGTVLITAEERDGYVELSVTDSGVGMTDDDIAHILREKVFDPTLIGQTLTADWRGKKGGGYGLLNCKGIIDKYRKTAPLFEVCRMGIDSRVGEGSRFWFRLPRGVRRTLTLLILCLLTPLGALAHPLLERASAFADSVYYANVDGRHLDALAYADSAFSYLNAHHRAYATEYIDTLTAVRGETDVETRWWLSDYATDYHAILDVRNELAVAYLALHRLPEYRYNNRIYNDLYKLVSEDRTLIDYCDRMQRYYSNISVAVLIGLLMLLGYLIIIVRAFMGRVAHTYRTIESAEDDERRARHEEHRLHVQNMVLDNCLSTLKHETVYYPHRIKQLTTRLTTPEECRQAHELIAYYRSTYGILASCASRQVEEVTFRRVSVASAALLRHGADYHARRWATRPEVPALEVVPCDERLQCDVVLGEYLVEQLIDAMLTLTPTDLLQLRAERDGAFVRITLSNRSRHLDGAELHTLFHPSSSRIVQVDGRLQGAEYIICRQIIREHDDHFRHIGCRIKAEPTAEGHAIWFTLPREGE